MGNTAKVDKFTMCMEKFNGEDIRRVIKLHKGVADGSCTAA